MPIILKIALPYPLRLSFDYLLNDPTTPYEIGSRVLVSFRSREIVGFITDSSKENNPKANIKPIIKCLDPISLLSKDLLSLTQWISDYYHHPIGNCFKTILPKKIRQGEEAKLQTEIHWELSSQIPATNLGKKQQQIINLLLKNNKLSQSNIYSLLGQCKSSLTLLEKQQLISKKPEIKLPTKVQPLLPNIQLNKEQKIAVDTIWQAKANFSPFLLHGITGSGKTEVYIELAKKVIAKQQQVLILIPEIGLTTQFVTRFKQQLSATIVVLNSAISDGERKQAWLLANKGLADIVIGTRSAVFTPLDKLGLIIIDEEHDASYKQIEGLKYHARNIALVRAKKALIPIVMGSATPSLESLYNVQRKRYTQLNLTQRATGASLPEIRLIDSNGPKAENGITSLLYEGIKKQLNANNQVLLFINRRGFAPVLMCHECNWQASCTDCDTKLTVHYKNNTLCCHHCGLIQRLPVICPRCSHADLKTYGAGTEKIELSLQKYFPDTPILRIDRDSTQRKNAFSDMITEINKGGSKILVGTQMLAKGHDFHNITLVGVLDADQGLLSADFRATENLAQLITQVTGRAGRGDKSGKVYIQTSQIQHPFWHDIVKKGYPFTAQKLLEERIQMAMPPAGYLSLIKAEDKQEQQAMQFLSDIQALLNSYTGDVVILGPVPAIMEKKAGRFRAQLLLSCPQRKPIHQLLDYYIDAISSLKLAKKVHWSIDIDPLDLM